jgi:hypothetical protein
MVKEPTGFEAHTALPYLEDGLVALYELSLMLLAVPQTKVQVDPDSVHTSLNILAVPAIPPYKKVPEDVLTNTKSVLESGSDELPRQLRVTHPVNNVPVSVFGLDKVRAQAS